MIRRKAHSPEYFSIFLSVYAGILDPANAAKKPNTESPISNNLQEFQRTSCFLEAYVLQEYRRAVILVKEEERVSFWS